MGKVNRSYNDTSLAFDFEMFDRRAHAPKKPVKNRTETEKKAKTAQKNKPEVRRAPASQQKQSEGLLAKAAARFGVSTVIAAAVLSMTFITVCCLLVASGQRLNDLSNEITEREAQLVLLQQDYEGLKLSYESDLNDAKVEEYAVRVLGMQKRESSQTEQLLLSENDVFEVLGKNNGSSWLAESMSGLMSAFA